MRANLFLSADEVAEELSISKPFAYKIIKKLNDELDQKGYMTIQGRVSRKYFCEKFYGVVDSENSALV